MAVNPSHRSHSTWPALLLAWLVIARCDWPTGSGSMCVAQESRKWPVEFELGQFHVHSDFQLVAPEKLGTELQELSAELAEMLPGAVHDQRVHIVIFQHRDSYQRYMQHYFPIVPGRPAIFLKDRGPGILFTYWHAEVMTDLRHEVTHALLSHGTHQLPLWLDEGLAEYFEVPRDERFSGHPYVQLDQPLIPLEQLETIVRLDAFTDQHYVSSWRWIHFLLHRHPQTRQLIIDSLHRRAAGQAVLPVSRLLQAVVERPSDELAAHFRQLRN